MHVESAILTGLVEFPAFNSLFNRRSFMQSYWPLDLLAIGFAHDKIFYIPNINNANILVAYRVIIVILNIIPVTTSHIYTSLPCTNSLKHKHTYRWPTERGRFYVYPTSCLFSAQELVSDVLVESLETFCIGMSHLHLNWFYGSTP